MGKEEGGTIRFSRQAKEDIDELLDAGRISELKAMGRLLETAKEAFEKGSPLPPNIAKAVLGYDEQFLRIMNNYSGREIKRAPFRARDFPVGFLSFEDVFFVFLDPKATCNDEEISFEELPGCRFLSVGYENGYKIYLASPKGAENIVIEARGGVFPPIPLQRKT